MLFQCIGRQVNPSMHTVTLELHIVFQRFLRIMLVFYSPKMSYWSVTTCAWLTMKIGFVLEKKPLISYCLPAYNKIRDLKLHSFEYLLMFIMFLIQLIKVNSSQMLCYSQG